MVRHALGMLLDAAEGFRMVGEARHGGEALARFRETNPDVVLMDIQMPVKDGITATRELLGDDPDARILALTAFSSERHIVEALRAGTAGYLLKDASPREILGAIRAVHRGEAVLSPVATRELIEAVRSDEPTRLPPPSPQPDPGLTPRELEAVEHLAKGMSNREIARDMFISEATVKATLGRAAQKLQVRDRVQVLIKAVQLGLVDVT